MQRYYVFMIWFGIVFLLYGVILGGEQKMAAQGNVDVYLPLVQYQHFGWEGVYDFGTAVRQISIDGDGNYVLLVGRSNFG